MFTSKRGRTSVQHMRKKTQFWCLTVEILNKFLHISCLPLFLLYLLHLQLDTVFSHTHLFTMSTRKKAESRSRSRVWKTQAVKKAEPLLLSEKPCMNSPQAMKFACNFQYRENREKSAGRNVVPISLTKGAGKRRLLVNDWPCQKTLNNPNNGSRHSQFLKSHAHLLFPSNRVISVAN